MTQGYFHPRYARSFEEFGELRQLEHSGAWVLERAIAGTDLRDAMGLYPLFCCNDWNALRRDLEENSAKWVTLALVADPFGDYDTPLLERTFDVAFPFKEHYIADTQAPLNSFVSKSHRSNARRALRKVDVEVCLEPHAYLDDWVDLFGVLAKKHAISGLRAFSRAAFEKQLQVPGLTMFRAVHDGRTVGLDLWYVQDDVAQGHLAAFSDEGYGLGASYATKWTLLNHFSDKAVRWVNFGGLPGSANDASGGLGHFKRGWSNTTQPSYFCGRILDPQAYDTLIDQLPKTPFFPAYRAGERS